MPNELTPVDFHGARLLVRWGDTPETTVVAMKPVVEGIGLDWKTQLRKVQKHPVLSKGVVILTIPSAGGPQETVGLALTLLNFWMTTVNARKVAPDLAANIIRYQTECAAVLFAHFFGKATGKVDAELSEGQFNRIGGINKAVINKALDEKLDEKLDKALAPIRSEFGALVESVRAVMGGFDPAQSVSIDYLPTLRFLIEQNVPAKGRRALSTRCSTLLRNHCITTGHVWAMKVSRETGRLLFHRVLFHDWAKGPGKQIFADHAARLSGQAALPLPKPRKSRGKRS